MVSWDMQLEPKLDSRWIEFSPLRRPTGEEHLKEPPLRGTGRFQVEGGNEKPVAWDVLKGDVGVLASVGDELDAEAPVGILEAALKADEGLPNALLVRVERPVEACPDMPLSVWVPWRAGLRLRERREE